MASQSKVTERTITNQKVARKNFSEAQTANILQHASMPTSAKSSNTYTHYLSPQEVEIQALPIVNVDLSMLTIHKNATELQQSLPVQLRLYIDEFGKVAKIDRIAMVLPQDDEMAKQLETLLKEVQFTPAKREFANVKSYQDVAFDFKASL
jgi:hypothetical protein